MPNTIRSFTDLVAWKKSHHLVLDIYKITQDFPKEEIFGITNQMRRCSVLVTSNIVEGFSRKFKKEKIYFYRISLGSLTELQNQLLIARDVNYLKKETFNKISQKTIECHKLINGLIKSAQDF